MSPLLNTQKAYLQKARRFEKGLPDLFLHAWVETQLLERLKDLPLAARQLKQGFFFENAMGFPISPFYHKGCRGVIDAYHLPFRNHTWDALLESMHLHILNDVPAYLKEVKRILKRGAYYVSAFLGGESAKALRYKLIELEANLFGTATLRLVPTLRTDQIGKLLEATGFQSTVIECVEVTTHYSTFRHLIQDIRQAGENGILVIQRSSYQRQLWKKLEEAWQDLMPLKLEIIFITTHS